jgi:hypothetical protein
MRFRSRLLVMTLLLSCAAEVAHADLQASAGCSGGRVVVVNKDSEHWFEVKIEVNRDYVHETAVIPKGETMRFFPNIFTKHDGTRLNLAATACKTIDIHATVRGKRDHWNGAYK